MLGIGRGSKDDKGSARNPSYQRPGNAQKVFSYYTSGERGAATGGAERGQHTAERARASGREERVAAVKHFVRWQYLPAFIACFCIILSLSYLFVLGPAPLVSITPEKAPVYHTRDEYEAAIQDIIKSSVLNRSKITINTTKLRNQIAERFPEVDMVTVALPVMGAKVRVGLDVEPPAAILISGGTSVLVNNEGRAVLPLSEAASSLVEGLPVIQDESTITPQVGKVALPSTSMRFIAALTAQAKAKQLPISGITLPNLPNEIRVKFDAPYYVKFDMSGDARAQFGTYQAVKDRLKSDSITPAEYIDVRVNEKAFYK